MVSSAVQEPQWDGLGSRSEAMMGVAVAFLVLTWVAVSLRVYVRSRVIQSFKWDDWTMVLTLLIFSVYCACLIRVEQLETDRVVDAALRGGWVAQVELLSRIMIYVIISMGLYLVTTVVLKVSLAILFLRVVVKPFQRHIICAATVVYAIYGVVFAFIAIFQCGDPRDFLLHAAEHKCLSNEVLQPLNYVCGVLNAMTDWIFATMAILVVWQSNMPRATKLTAGFLLGLGALGSICSIARLPYIPGLKAGPSFLGNSIKIAIWSIIEPGLGIVAASLSTLRPLFKSLLERTRSLTSSGRHHTSRPRRTYDNRGSGLSFGDRNASQFHQVQDDYRSTITTVVGNAKAGTSLELRDIGYNPDKVMSLDEESERRDSVGHSLKRSESQKRLRRQESQRSLSRYPPSPSTCPSPSQAWVSNGRVVMTKQVNVHDFSV